MYWVFLSSKQIAAWLLDVSLTTGPACPDQFTNVNMFGTPPIKFDYHGVLSVGTDQNSSGSNWITDNESEQRNFRHSSRPRGYVARSNNICLLSQHNSLIQWLITNTKHVYELQLSSFDTEAMADSTHVPNQWQPSWLFIKMPLQPLCWSGRVADKQRGGGAKFVWIGSEPDVSDCTNGTWAP